MSAGPVVSVVCAVLLAASAVPAAAASEADGGSFSPSISGDGSVVAFGSRATTLAAGDTNGADDVFVHEVARGTTRRVSVGPGGAEGDAAAFSPSVSPDGRFVAFESEATTLSPSDTNGVQDVFLHDLVEGTTARVSVASEGTQADGSSFSPSVSDGAAVIAFGSEAGNLVPGDTNGTEDVFVHEPASGATTIVSLAADGGPADGRSLGPSVSADGRYVAFTSFATNIVTDDDNGAADVFVRDRVAGVTIRFGGREPAGRSFSPRISADGRYVAFVSFATDLVPGDTNEALDAFVGDVATGEVTRVSVASDGGEADGLTFSPAITADGRFVAFKSEATNLVASDTNMTDDVFVHDRETGETLRVSVASDGTEGNAASVSPSMSAEGRFIAFSSFATNLVAGDGNGVGDVFIHDRWTGTTVRASTPQGAS